MESEGLQLLSRDDSKTRDQKAEQKRILKLAIKAYEDLGILPATLAKVMPNGIRDLSADPKDGQALAQTALGRQTRLREELASSLASQAQTYAQGIQKQVTKLREEGNKGDAQILESEARLALAEPLRFLSIVEGVNPPAGRASTAEEILIRERILGEWTCGSTGTSYHFLGNGRITGKGFDKEGHWQVRAQKITVRWDNAPIHVLAFSDFEENPDLCEGEILTKGQKIKALRKVPLAEQELADIKPILGEWIHEADDGPVTYTFRENKTANDGRWNSRGTYQKNFEGGYRVDWIGGKSFNLDFEGEDTLIIRGLKFRMNRRK